jgi:hypothetical protein
MPLFGRRSRATTVAAPTAAPVLGDLLCSEKGCGESTGIPCAYVDRRGRQCTTAWCPEHRVEVEGRAYCRRHAGVTRALEGSDTPTAPDISSRAASLAAWIASDLHARVVALLEQASEPGEQLRVQPPRLVFVGRQRVRAWEHAWKLARHTGLGHWVAVQVPEERDEQVEVIVDGNSAHSSVPPWIAARRDGRSVSPEEDAQARERYYDGIVSAIEAALRTPPRH